MNTAFNTTAVARAAEHYDALAEHYTWMFGDFDANVAEQRVLLESLLGLSAVPSRERNGTPHRALDLGAGSGFQSVALA